MLFNYPKSDIHKFYKELSHNGESHVVNASHMFESIADLRSISILNKPISRRGSNLGELSRLNESYMRKESINSVEWNRGSELVEMSLNSGLSEFQRIDMNNGLVTEKQRMSRKKTLQMSKFMPTNLGNQIVLLTEKIYDKFGNDDQMSFEGFIEWAKHHEHFIYNFRKYLRYNLWKTVTSEKTNKLISGYTFLTPFLQEEVQISKGLSKATKNSYAALYLDFLVIWKTRDNEAEPSRVVILKSIAIEFNEVNQSIHFSSRNKKYKPLAVKLKEMATWKFWKYTLEKHSR
jgi:hypothetical protein